MFRSALAAAFRYFLRGKLYAAIAVIGLGVGFCVVLLTLLYIRSEYSNEHFVAGYQDLYLATTVTAIPGQRRQFSQQTPQGLAALIRIRFPQVASVSRMSGESVVIRSGDLELGGVGGERPLVSVDPDFFQTAPMPVLAGDPVAALAKPDTIVMAQGSAQRFFGEDAPLGRTLEVEAGGKVVTLTVGAVLKEIRGSRLFSNQSIFVSGESSWTGLARFAQPPPGANSAFLRGYVTTLVRLQDGVAPRTVRDALADLSPQIPGWSDAESLDMIRVDQLRTDPDYNPAITYSNVMMTVLMVLILSIAGMNFVNLLTARSGERSLETGLRKLAGAGRVTLALQFIGETFLHVLVAVVIGLALAELLLPYANALMFSDVEFAYWKDPVLIGSLLAGTVLFAILAGLWPALVLSKLPPGAIHGQRLARGSGGFLRNVLVALQFAALTLLILRVETLYLERHFASEKAKQFDVDQVLVLETGCSPGRMEELRRLDGVIDAACSGSQLLGGEGTANGIKARTRDGQEIPMAGIWIDDRMLDLYGIRPLAGRGLTAGDFGTGAFGRPSTRFLINESAMRALGFASPADALGPYAPAIDTGPTGGNGLDEIIGVLPDFSMAKLRFRVVPTVFFANPMQFSTISVRLDGTRVPETLQAIDRVWKSTRGRGGEAPIGTLNRKFYEERLDYIYLPMMVEARVFAFFSLVGISLALFGLLGIAALAADRRSREIGIRKAQGAATGDVLRMLLLQFTRPVLWGSLLAWVAGGWWMQRWLDGFAFHIDPPLWLFPATTFAILLVALGTVAAYAIRISRMRPAVALRHE